MKHLGIILATLVMWTGPLSAGVVFELQNSNSYGGERSVENNRFSVDGKKLKMHVNDNRAGSNSTMIFRGDRREMVVVNHDDKSYMVIDQQALTAIGGQMSKAMQQMEEAMKNVPPEQRAMMEKLMKGRMPAAMGNKTRAKTEVRNSGESGTENGYPVTRYQMFRDGVKTRELWVTDWKNVDGGNEARAAFDEMAAFFKQMMDAFSSGPMGGFGAQFDDNPFEYMNKIDGFPVVTKELTGNGSVENETRLISSERRSLDAAEFEPPAGYKRQAMPKGF